MKILILVTMFVCGIFSSSIVYATCTAEEQKAANACSPEKFKAYEARLAAVNKEIAGRGAGTQAQTGYDSLDMEKKGLDAQIAACKKERESCTSTCKSSAAQKRAQTPVPDTAGAQQDEQKQAKCEKKEHKEAEDKAKSTSSGMGEAMQALAALMGALGMGQETPETAELPFCTQYPEDPSCKTDTAVADTGSTLTSGEFRRDDGGTLVEGDLGTEASPVGGPAAAQTMSGPMAGASMPSLGGSGGGSGSSGRSRSYGDRKSEFDGSPKINLAGGAMSGGGGGGGKGGGSSLGGKSSGNPTAGRTSLDNEQQAGKIAAAAEERLRGPASNEPLGGISSVYYLDNFSKVEKRMITERNTLQEH